jgi:hypothetical protein
MKEVEGSKYNGGKEVVINNGKGKMKVLSKMC